jgi:hypothetical protein
LPVSLAEEFEFFARSQCEGRSPTYARCSYAVAADPDLLDLVSPAEPGQRRPTLLFAAIQYLLLRGEATGEFAAWFPAVSGQPIPVDDPVPALRRFCAEHRDAILRQLATGRTQTNEVRRCAALLLALNHASPHQPVGLLELGASAGLNLLVDRYAYAFGDTRLGDSPVHLSPTLHSGLPTVPHLPTVDWRLGGDLAPVDLSDDAAVDWLRAFIWPEQAAERDRLTAAIALARAQPPTVVAANAVTDLDRLLDLAPVGQPVCVFHATLLTYVDSEGRAELFAALRRAIADRAIHWIYLEAAGLLSGPGGPAAVTDRHREDRDTYVLGVVGPAEDTVLARVATYGESIHWLA